MANVFCLFSASERSSCFREWTNTSLKIIKHSKTRSYFSDLSDRDCIVVQLDVDYIATLPACYALGLAISLSEGLLILLSSLKTLQTVEREKNLTSQVNGQQKLCQNKQWLLFRNLFVRKIQST